MALGKKLYFIVLVLAGNDPKRLPEVNSVSRWKPGCEWSNDTPGITKKVGTMWKRWNKQDMNKDKDENGKGTKWEPH